MTIRGRNLPDKHFCSFFFVDFCNLRNNSVAVRKQCYVIVGKNGNKKAVVRQTNKTVVTSFRTTLTTSLARHFMMRGRERRKLRFRKKHTLKMLPHNNKGHYIKFCFKYCDEIRRNWLQSHNSLQPRKNSNECT